MAAWDGKERRSTVDLEVRVEALEREARSSKQDRMALWSEMRRNSNITEQTRTVVAEIKSKQDEIKAKQESLPAETAKAVGDMLAVRKAVRFAGIGLGTGALSALGASVWHWVLHIWRTP